MRYTDTSEDEPPKIEAWRILAVILMLSLCCGSYLLYQSALNAVRTNTRDLYCRQIQTGMSRADVFAALSRAGEFNAHPWTDDKLSAYTISFVDPLKSLQYSGNIVLYFEDGFYQGKVTYDSGGDFLPVCS